jgi:DNA polymerase-3 subunit delta
MTATKVDKRIKLFATARKAGFLWELAAPRRLRGWVEAEAESLGVTLARGAGSRLVEVVGKDVSRLAVALEMLSLYTGGAPVTAEAVDDLIAHTRESSVFELTDAIGDGDQMAALTAIASLIDQRQSALGAVMMLARHVRQLIRARLLVGAGAGTAEIASQLKVPPFIADKVAGQARRASLRGLVRSLQRLSAADRALKGQELKMRTLGKSLGERVVLEELARELIDLQR